MTYGDPFMAVIKALSSEQEAAIMARFTAINPHWRGAAAADVIEALCDHDSDLEQIEPFFVAHPSIPATGGIGAWPSESWRACSAAARAIIWSGGTLTETSMRALLTAAGLMP